MPIASPAPIRDPLHIFLERRGAMPARRPIPLVSTDFAVAIEGGLAIVTTTRVFRNDEEDPIEATLTFPMPVHATLFDLRIKIGGRELIAKAYARDSARTTYEDAVDRGKSAVLHEEVLRGIHMLSVANIPAGEEIEVRTAWVTTLTVISSAGHLRIPVTVGDVYGRSPLAESDDIKTGGEPLLGTLEVHSPEARTSLVGGVLENGKARLLLNRPIDLIVDNWRQGTVQGLAADGRSVSLHLKPAPDEDSSLNNIAILVDHSGSMQQPVGADPHSSTKHDHVVAALRRLAGTLTPAETIDLWEFDDNVHHIGTGKLSELANHLSGPSGGTEIGQALATSIRESSADGILLITDGKSHALDVQGLAQMGRRITVVLVGEDSLEANVGYLAALTGGDIFVSGGADIHDLLETAASSLRGSTGTVTTSDQVFLRSGMSATVSYGPALQAAVQTHKGRAIAAAAASFLLPTLSEEQAAQLAQREGIVSHLTSLVLVDEAGATQEMLPGQRPVALPRPATAGTMHVYACAMAPPDDSMLRRRSAAVRRKSVPIFTSRAQSTSMELARQVDWASDPARLIAGDLSQLSRTVRKAILALENRSSVQHAGTILDMWPLLLVIGLLAYQAGRAGDRAAARIAHRLLGQFTAEEIQKLVSLLDE